MKVYYFNDEKQEVTIRLIGPAPDCTNTFVKLQPQKGQMFEIAAPAGKIPFVKRWDNRTVLLSYMDDPAGKSSD